MNSNRSNYRRWWCSAGVMLSCVMFTGSATAAWDEEQQPKPTEEGLRFFEAKIRPVLVEHCYRCHSADGSGIRGGLAVDSRDALLAGGESGPAIVPGDLEQSLLWNAINHQDLNMPPKQKLPEAVIADFRTWIEMGAPDPRASTGVVVKSRVGPEDIEKGREFWAFKMPVRPSIPPETEWARTNIDRLVSAKYQEQNLAPNPDADAHTLLRRLSIDLVGLPPSPQAIARFVKSWELNREDAIASEIDRLLDTPQFGERWGRHWLDVARYAESAGKEVDLSFPHAWRYRDYVIESFNQDKPYDEFVREQIAGDLLPAKDDAEWAEHLIATGFLALGPKALIEQNPRQFQADLIDEQVDVTTRVFMGVSVACARCHDHKFDPIPQTDYYAVAGIFQSTATLYGGARTQRNRQPSNLIILPADDPDPNVKSLSREELAEMRRRRDELEREALEARRAARQPQKTDGDQRRNFANQFLLEQQATQLTNQINSVDDNGEPITACMGVQDAAQIRNARVLVRGEIDQPAQEVKRGFVQVLSSENVELSSKTSGRLELARWMTSPDHPLTARVMVNRIWQHLIGDAIVRETENFGASGPGPTHAELLDYLAVRFVESGWSVKAMIREIASSRVYQLSSAYDVERIEKDPDNLYHARGNTRRLDAEVIRDGMLAASGQIDLKRPRGSMISGFGSGMIRETGPAMALPQTPPGGPDRGEVRRQGVQNLIAAARARQSGTSFLDTTVYYRSVYLPIARNSLPRALEVFDFAEPSMVIGERESSNTPGQALYMLNNAFVLEQSDALARRLLKEAETPTDRIRLAFELVYNRPPTEDEVKVSQQFLRGAMAAGGDTRGSGVRDRNEQAFAGLSQFCQSLFASAEYRYAN